MTAMVRIACRVIERRVMAGESWETVIADYPRLTAEQVEEIQAELEGGGEQ
ncbi:DUF433 domain-containing protein [Gehongia tenuis]|uniref:DUF433 domain-containing protein n=1 Tax=Gehongia tenuis TaxID=2763655 RepID=A0A926D5S7_9FIRM|nr:DUF433 domain-containing protein [Gehongia tenuis]MBC8531761.1 DUF433 domain-containing protein [Gehongia tenuis]